MTGSLKLAAGAVWVGLLGWVTAEEPSSQPATVPATRWELKKALEDRTKTQPRIPAPAPIPGDEKSKLRSSAGQGGMRRLLDPELKPNWPRDWLDDNMPIGKTMRNQLLWVTSRVNNCFY